MLPEKPNWEPHQINPRQAIADRASMIAEVCFEIQKKTENDETRSLAAAIKALAEETQRLSEIGA